jgi:uncharacterized membrane protein YfcA
MTSVIAVFSTRKWLIPRIPEEVFLGDAVFVTKRALILTVFAMLVIVSSLMILLKHKWASNDDGKERLKLLLPVSFTTGILGGFVGAGGGFLILPSLIIFARLPFKIAVGTTLLVIGLNSLLGFLGDVMNYSINWLFLALITGLASVGMILGNFYGARIPASYLRLSFAWIMLITAIVILVTELLL